MQKRVLSLVMFSSIVGTAIEFYDFFIFGFCAASVFPETFFPEFTKSAALTVSLAAFGAGFPARLAGSFLFGHFGDRAGRKGAYVATIALVGGATILTAFLPSYRSIGPVAPLLLVLLRIIQGIGLGGEFGGGTSLLAEHASEHPRKAALLSLLSAGIPLGAMAASGAMYIFASTFSTWGWRAALLLQALVIIPALVARLKLVESPIFQQIRKREMISSFPSLWAMWHHRTPILIISGIIAFQQMDGYVSGTYIISYMRSFSIPLPTVAEIIFIGRIGDLAGLLIGGTLFGLLGARFLGLAAVALTTILVFPFILAIVNREMFLVALLQFLISCFGVGILHALGPILAADAFPANHRHSGAGISYNLSAILGGMLAPFLLSALVGARSAALWFAIPSVYVAYALLSMGCLCFAGLFNTAQSKDVTSNRSQTNTPSRMLAVKCPTLAE